MRRGALAAALATLAAALPATSAAASAAAAPTCARESIPSWQAVTGASLGVHPATDEQVDAYLGAVDRASDRVRAGVMGQSVQGRPLPYAVVSDRRNLTHLAAIAARLRAVRAGRATRVPRGSPAIVWIAASVHPNEPSGTDADMAILRELASGRLCAPLRKLIVVFAPLQNPDGRAAGTRTNANGFDLNRDWFAASQPETRAKLALLQELPPLVFADQHEQLGQGFFFPPNADPIYHEVPGAALHAIDDTFGPALARAFGRAHRPFSNGGAYDLFFMGYGDTVPTTLFGAAGMTFEQGGGASLPQRIAGHELAARTVLVTAARHRDALLRAWAHSWRQARAQGERGELQPNVVVRPGHRVRFRVPRGRVYDYLLRDDVHGADAAALVARLRAVGVRVGRLRRALRLPAYRAYGSRAARAATLPAGTWVVPMGQTAKHWVEAMLGQDAHVPFPYFYDVSSWSNPLLMGLAGGWSERPLPAGAVALDAPATTAAPGEHPAYAFAGDSVPALALASDLLAAGATVVRTPVSGEITAAAEVPGTAAGANDAIPTPLAPGDLLRLAAVHGVALRGVDALPAGAVALRAPKVALLADLTPVVLGAAGRENSQLHESHTWTRFVLRERLDLPVDELGDAELAAGRLRDGGYTALVVADGRIPAGVLGPAALAEIQAFVAAGGTYVGVRSLGLQLAQAAGVTTATARATPRGFQVPGATFAVTVDGADPLGWGAGGPGFQLDANDPVLAPGAGAAVVRYDAGPRLVSGYARDTGVLSGTPALLDAGFGAGRVALFAGDPSYRAYVESGQRLLANALLAPPPAPAAIARHAAIHPLRAAAGAAPAPAGRPD